MDSPSLSCLPYSSPNSHQTSAKQIDFSESRIRNSLRFAGVSDDTIDLMGRQITKVIAGNRVILANLVGETGSQAQAILEVFRGNKATGAIREIAISVGADGIILRDKSAPLPCFDGEATHIVAFNSSQIKSAVGNSGAFDSNDNDICDGVRWILSNDMLSHIDSESSPCMT